MHTSRNAALHHHLCANCTDAACCPHCPHRPTPPRIDGRSINLAELAGICPTYSAKPTPDSNTTWTAREITRRFDVAGAYSTTDTWRVAA